MTGSIHNKAVERLAKQLHWKMEHLDPTEDPDWEHLSDHQRDFYRSCINWLLMFGDDFRIAFES